MGQRRSRECLRLREKLETKKIKNISDYVDAKPRVEGTMWKILGNIKGNERRQRMEDSRVTAKTIT